MLDTTELFATIIRTPNYVLYKPLSTRKRTPQPIYRHGAHSIVWKRELPENRQQSHDHTPAPPPTKPTRGPAGFFNAMVNDLLAKTKHKTIKNTNA